VPHVRARDRPRTPARSIRLRKDDAPLRWLACDHAPTGFLRPVKWNTANGRLRFGGDAILRLARAVPVRPQKAACLLDLPLEFLVGIDLVAVRLTETERALEEIGL